MIKKDWNNIWKRKIYWVGNDSTNNVNYFYNYHLKKLKKNSKILDHGCGNGRNFNFLTKKGFDVYGCDISEKVIQKNKKDFPKYKKKFFLGDIKNLNFKNNFFDAIVADASIYYQKKENMFKTIDIFHKILKKDGLIRVYTKSIFDNFYFNHKRKNSFEYIVKKKHWENGLLITFLSFKDVEKLFKKFKEVKIGIEEFNYLDFKRKHSYWVITASK